MGPVEVCDDEPREEGLDAEAPDESARHSAPNRLQFGQFIADERPAVMGTAMLPELKVSLPLDQEFYRKAVCDYVTPKGEKIQSKGFRLVTRKEPPKEGTICSQSLEDSLELEAKLGIPADKLGSLLEAFCCWQDVELPHVELRGQGFRDFEDCMEAAIALNTLSRQLRVTFGTTVVYRAIDKRTGRRPGMLNLLPRTNDLYKPEGLQNCQTRAYCHQCALSGQSLDPPQLNRDGTLLKRGRVTDGDGWFNCPDAVVGLRGGSSEVVGNLANPQQEAYRHEHILKAATLGDLHPEVQRQRVAVADEQVRRMHAQLQTHDFVPAMFARNQSIPMSFEIRYIHGARSVELEFALPLRAMAELAAYTAYWPASCESARFRLISRPLHQCENGLESIELLPAHAGKLRAAPSDAAAPVFHLPSAHDSLPATCASLSQLQLTLSAGQLRTLRWALSREGREADGKLRDSATHNDAGFGDTDFVSTQVIDRRFGETDLIVQLRVERVYSGVRGGILAHAMGYGKTAIMIALLHCTNFERGAGINAEGSPPKRRRFDSVGGTSCPLQVYTPSFQTGATLIVTPVNLFHQWIAEFRKFLGDDVCGLRLLPIGDIDQLRATTRTAVQHADVVVIAFTLFLSDEYKQHFDVSVGARHGDHPVARYAALRQYMQNQLTPSDSKRTLRALPEGPVIIEMFQWDRVIFDEFHKCVASSEQSNASWRALHEITARFRWGLTGTPDLTLPLRVSEMAAMLHIFVPPDNRIESQRFLDLWVRADEWDMSAIRTTSQLIQVVQTPTERALYLARKQLLQGAALADDQLLPFCSHFAPEVLGNSGTAGAAVKEFLIQRGKEIHQRELNIAELRSKHFRLQEAEEQLEQMKRAVAFLTNTMDYVQKLNGGQQHECSICLDDCSHDRVSVTRCGHIFCTDCITSTIAAAGMGCPTCRSPLRIQDVDPIVKLSPERGQEGQEQVDCSRFGTKVARIIKELRRIHANDDSARVLVFVQWNELLLKMEAAFQHYRIDCVALRGGVAERQRMLTAFAEGTKRYVLLMAMEHDDSGLNLVCSNHVFFVHPMAAEPEVVRACERQALGRVRRRGQAKDVCLYRFVAAGTIEEARANQHHRVLFPEG